MLVGRRVLRSSDGFRLLAARWVTSDGYLHKTVIPSDKFQDSLPKLPVPPLDESVGKYLSSAEALLTADEMAVARNEVADFVGGAGPALQAELEGRAKQEYTSYISDWWFSMYLEGRDGLMLNVNPQLTFQDDPNPAKNTQLERATSLVSSSARFIRTLRDGHLEPDVFHTGKWDKTDLFNTILKWMPRSIAFYAAVPFGAYALDMSQYHGLIGSSRIPRPGRDELKKFPDSRHIVVQYGTQFFTFDIISADGTSVPPPEIKANLRAILDLPVENTGPAVGALTSTHRDKCVAASKRVV